MIFSVVSYDFLLACFCNPKPAAVEMISQMAYVHSGDEMCIFCNVVLDSFSSLTGYCLLSQKMPEDILVSSFWFIFYIMAFY